MDKCTAEPASEINNDASTRAKFPLTKTFELTLNELSIVSDMACTKACDDFSQAQKSSS